MECIIGTAGWSIPARDAAGFGVGASSLERYATRFRGAEINSSFHRSHRASTWERWRDSVPADFRFAAKLPKTITHQAKLVDCSALIEAFAAEVATLGDKLAVVLVQLPPKLSFDPAVAEPFLDALEAALPVQLVCEPRHPSWFEEAAGEVLAERRVARVAADPACVPAAALPGGWDGFAYWRLHGSPRMYRSSYDDGRLAGYAKLIRTGLDSGRPTWCMFDNTASSAAIGDAVVLARELGQGWMPDEDSNLD